MTINESISPKLKKWEGFAIKKMGASLLHQAFYNFQSRNSSSLKLIIESINEYGVKDFDWILIHTGDRCPDHLNANMIQDLNGRQFPFLSYSTSYNNFTHTIPDFIFDHWKEAGIDDFERIRRRIKRHDIAQPKSNLLGWRGANNTFARNLLVNFKNKLRYDFEYIQWPKTPSTNTLPANFLSLDQQIHRWRYLIDIEGEGYSGRLKLLLNSPRLVFIQWRKHQEFFYPMLKPWVHFVPVANDLSDLEANLEIIVNNPELEQKIIGAQREFAQLYLNRDFAKYYLAKRLSEL